MLTIATEMKGRKFLIEVACFSTGFRVVEMTFPDEPRYHSMALVNLLTESEQAQITALAKEAYEKRERRIPK